MQMHDANLDSNDYYANLGLSRDATEQQIKTAYRRLVILYHPDKNPIDKISAEEKFKIVGEAYNVLSNKDMREIYDMYGKEGLEDGAEPMTKRRAVRMFKEFFRFGEAMDPKHPTFSRGIMRAAGGAVYAPVKGIMYSGKTVLGGLAMGSASVIIAIVSLVVNVASGVKEMSEAGVNAAKKSKRRSNENEEAEDQNSRHNDTDSQEHAKYEPEFVEGLKKATVDAVTAPVAALVSGGGILVASGIKAGGYLVGGFAGAASNIASGVEEVKAANRLGKREKAKRKLRNT